LIYGRRKTGKSTLVKKNLHMDYYVLIADSNSAITADDKVMKINDTIKEVKELSIKEHSSNKRVSKITGYLLEYDQ
jgi:hypothetical protein